MSHEECIVPDDHESFDMMRIVLILDSCHDCIYTIESCDLSLIFCSAIVPPLRREWNMMIE
jgi:hypothetical protein